MLSPVKSLINDIKIHVYKQKTIKFSAVIALMLIKICKNREKKNNITADWNVGPRVDAQK